MISLRIQDIKVALKVYVAGTLIAATILSSPALSFIPILLLASYLFFWRWPIRVTIHLLTDYFMFFAIAILLAPFVGPYFSILISLPVLGLITSNLEETTGSFLRRNTRYTRSPTSSGIALPLMAILVLCISLLFGNLSLLIASVTVIAYFGILGVVIVRRLPLKPVTAIQVRQRMVAGTKDRLRIELTTETKIGGTLFLESPYEWLKVEPSILPLKEKTLITEVCLSPPLSGPSIIKIKAHATDRWGLVQTRFELEPISLYVIPRARYAAWLARRYLAETKAGSLSLMSSIGALRPIYGLRRGVEYYGSRPYQSGDSLKNIDWKHSVKYDELITKELLEFYGQPAIVLINLAVADAEEADKLEYNIIVTAISLAQQNIPAALAAYDQEHVRLPTATLQPRQLLLQSLAIAQEVAIFSNPVRYLDPPDVTRLRADISRIQLAESEASRVLAQLLRIEYESLSNNARLSPASVALSTALDKAGKQSGILVISQHNHDAEALAFNTFSLTRKGNAVINI